MRGGNARTSTTAPRYLSLRKAGAVMEVVAVVAMGSEEYKTQSDDKASKGGISDSTLIRVNNHHLLPSHG